MYSEKHCVYRAADIGEADIVVDWLSKRGIAAEVKERHAAATMQVPMIVAPAGIEVCVIDPNEADHARNLLRDHFAGLKGEPQPEESDRTVEATCEECGGTVSFPSGQRGTVQLCPHCHAYIDVPG